MTNERAEHIKQIESQSIAEFLESLIGVRQEIRGLRERKDQIAQQIVEVSATKITGEVRGAEVQDIGRLLEKLESAQERVVQKMLELLDKEAIAQLLLDKCQDRISRTILRARYISGNSWRYIATGICGYKDISYPQKLKREALDYLERTTTMQEVVAEAKIKRLIK